MLKPETQTADVLASQSCTAILARCAERELQLLDGEDGPLEPEAAAEFFPGLPQWMWAAATTMFRLQRHRGEPELRLARWSRADGLPGQSAMPDPVWMHEHSHDRLSYTLFNSALMDPDAERAKLRAAVENIESGRLRWGLRRDQYKGATIAIVGSGPSCRDGVEADVTIAINSAIEALPRATYWCVMDGPLSWRPKIDVQHRLGLRATGYAGARTWLHRLQLAARPRTEGIWSPATNPRLVRSMPGHTWLPGHRGPARWYRHLFDADHPRLPTFVEGLISAVTAVQIAWYLGAAEIHLWGMEGASFGTLADAQAGYYAEGLTAAAPWDWSDAIELEPTMCVEGRPMVIKPTLINAAKYLNAVCMWIWDRKVPVLNRSRGLVYPFAPTPTVLGQVRAAMAAAKKQAAAKAAEEASE